MQMCNGTELRVGRASCVARGSGNGSSSDGYSSFDRTNSVDAIVAASVNTMKVTLASSLTRSLPESYGEREYLQSSICLCYDDSQTLRARESKLV